MDESYLYLKRENENLKRKKEKESLKEEEKYRNRRPLPAVPFLGRLIGSSLVGPVQNISGKSVNRW
jgi:hypothetical protein